MNILFPFVIFIAMFLIAVIGFAGFDSFKVLASVTPMPSLYFPAHVTAAFLAYFCFAFSFVAGLLYLNQDRALKNRQLTKGPSLETLEKWVFRGLLAGLPLLTVALLSGFVWLKNEFGTFWLWNAKLISSVFAWVIYLVLFYFHFVSSVHGRKMVILSVFAFSLILVTFLGLTFFDMQLHPR